MCGISGIAALGKGLDMECTSIVEMSRAIAHRGPDDEGFYEDKFIAIANRRLSIIDLPGGLQPMHNEDESVWVVFNGEIYNHVELHRLLEKNGHIFASKSDTEVIVHLYEEYGSDLVDKLNGMFAFAVWDKKSNTGFIARDRLGIKPLYYAVLGDHLIFASEIKSILANPLIKPTLDLTSLDLYLSLRYVPAANSIFTQIRKLLPGYILTFDCQAATTAASRYWNPARFVSDGPLASEQGLIDELGELLRDSVKIRMMSDVPFGAFLSGGLDSSGVVALMSGVMDDPVQTFSIGFSEEPRLDERSYARLVSKEFGTTHREVVCTADAVEALPKLLSHFDEPFADPIIAPFFQVSELAAKHVKVVLTGEGADELFGGYTRFVSDQYVRVLARVPSSIRQKFARLSGILPGQSIGSHATRALEMAEMSESSRFLQWVSAFDANEKLKLYRSGADMDRGDGDREMIDGFLSEIPNASPTSKMLYCEMLSRLPECMLARTDRVTMAVSLEGRTPFLDHRLVERVLGLADSFKVRGRKEKYVLSRVFSRVLPKQVLGRRKQGLAVPFAQWTRQGVDQSISRILTTKRFEQRGFFDLDYVRRLLKFWGPSAARHSQLIWSLLCFELWCRIYLDKDLDPNTPLSAVA